MLSKTSQYALRALHALVRAEGEWYDVETLAADYDLSAPYLAKVLADLGKRGFVESRKGPGGGFRASPEALETRVGDILRALDGESVLFRCIFGFPDCSDADPCPLHGAWSRVRESYEEWIDGATIADLGRDAFSRDE